MAGPHALSHEVSAFIYILVLYPCDTRLNKKYFDNIIKFNKNKMKKELIQNLILKNKLHLYT